MIMNLPALVVVFAATLTAAFGAWAQVPAPVASDGLVAVKSRDLDQVFLRPNVDLAGYRKIIIDRPTVTFQAGWLKSINRTRDVSRWLTPAYQQQLTDDITAGLARTMSDVFAARGYEVVTTPGPGVLQVTPHVTELFLNAPDLKSAGPTLAFSRDTGTATLVLEARDAASGNLLARVVDSSLARELLSGNSVGQLNYTTDVSNVFWMDALFRQWATSCAVAFAGGSEKVSFAQTGVTS
jgi:hypothetical protein